MKVGAESFEHADDAKRYRVDEHVGSHRIVLAEQRGRERFANQRDAARARDRLLVEVVAARDASVPDVARPFRLSEHAGRRGGVPMPNRRRGNACSGSQSAIP